MGFLLRDDKILLVIISLATVANQCGTDAFLVAGRGTACETHGRNGIDNLWRRYGLDFDAIEQDEECELGDGFFVETCIPVIEKKEVVLASSREELPRSNPDLTPEEVVELCMTYLQNNHVPVLNSGLEVCFEFSTDRCRSAYGGSLEAFLNHAANPTFQSMIETQNWDIVSIGPEIAGSATRGPMKTVLVEVTPSGQNEKIKTHNRRFLWTLQRERRPPRQGCWLVHECIFVNNAFAQTE